MAGQKQRATLRSDPHYIERLFDQWYPQDSAQRSIAMILADAIKYVASVNNACWGVTAHSTSIRFNVGSVEVLVLSNGLFRAVIDPASLSSSERAALRNYSNLTDHYSSVPGPKLDCPLPPDKVSKVAGPLRSGLTGYIQRICKTKKLYSWKDSFSPGIIGYLQSCLNKKLLFPSYIDEAWKAKIAVLSLEPQSGGGFGDPEQNRKVEAAAVALVCEDYRKRGWKVESREREKCGYDLLCTKGVKERHVEVKGVSGGECRFILTANEFQTAQADKRFELALVTNALDSSRRMWRWDSQAFLDNFCLTPLAYWVEGNLPVQDNPT